MTQMDVVHFCSEPKTTKEIEEAGMSRFHIYNAIKTGVLVNLNPTSARGRNAGGRFIAADKTDLANPHGSSNYAGFVHLQAAWTGHQYTSNPMPNHAATP
jgi:hypothetical protein